MAKPRAQQKAQGNLFKGGLLASTIVEEFPDQTSATRKESIDGAEAQQPVAEIEENDPLFGNTKRLIEITQKAVSVTDASTYPKIAIEKLDDNPYQPRRRMNQKRLALLANEIRNHGFKGVLLARVHPDDNQRFQLVYGHRRREASKLAELTELPVMVDNTINEEEMKFLAVNENAMRDDLTPLDEAYTFAVMLQEMSQDAIATRLGVSRGYIRNRIDILKAPEDVQDMVEEKPNTMKAVVYLKDIEEADIRQTAIQALMQEEITINQIKAFIENVRKAKTMPVAPSPKPQETPLSQAKGSTSSSNEDPTTESVHVDERAQSQTTIVPPPERTTRSKDTLIQHSKKQTEALTDQTKIETFTTYLQKYDLRLQQRQISPNEKKALEALVHTTQHILDRIQ